MLESVSNFRLCPMDTNHKIQLLLSKEGTYQETEKHFWHVIFTSGISIPECQHLMFFYQQRVTFGIGQQVRPISNIILGKSVQCLLSYEMTEHKHIFSNYLESRKTNRQNVPDINIRFKDFPPLCGPDERSPFLVPLFQLKPVQQSSRN